MDRSVSQAEGGTSQLLIAVVAALNVLAAVAGAVGLATGFLRLGPELTSRLPGGSALLGGVALGLLVALPNGALAVLAVRADRRTGPTAIAVGTVLVGWIVVELAFLRELSFFHPLYVAVGLVLVWLGARLVRATAGVTGRALLFGAWDCLVDLPVFVTSPTYRRWHLRWGATEAEVRAELPGDGVLARASYDATRAITIDAPPEQVWPWLVQVGCLRAGFYADDLLDNLGRPSARTIRPDLQELALDQLVPMSPSATPERSFRVAAYEAPSWLVWTKPDSTWAWRLAPTETGGTRLVTRLRAEHPWSRPVDGLLSLVLLELGDFAMMRRMLLGIRDRAEATR